MDKAAGGRPATAGVAIEKGADGKRCLRLSTKNKCILWVVIAVLFAVVVLRARAQVVEKLERRRQRRDAGRVDGAKTSGRSLFVMTLGGPEGMGDVAGFVAALFRTAEHPSRVRVGVCQVGGEGEQSRRVEGGFRSVPFLEEYHARGGDPLYDGNIRVYTEPRHERAGFANAAYMAHRYLYKNERYLACFGRPRGAQPTKGWDSICIEEVDRCVAANGARSMVTSALSPSTRPSCLTFGRWSENGTPVLVPREFRVKPVRAFRTAFLTSDFIACEGLRLADSPVWDPWMHGVPMEDCDWLSGVRLWCLGWEFYTPTRMPATRVGVRRTTQDDRSAPAGYGRAWSLLGLTTGGAEVRDEQVYRLSGRLRGVEEYCALSGVDWSNRTVHPHAKVGMCRPRAPRAFESEEVTAKYGSWTEFWEGTDYREDDIDRVG